MLERFAHFLLKRSRNAALVAFLCSILPVFFGSISVIIVALVTLRKGTKEGFFVLAWGVLPLVARAFVEQSYLFFAAAVSAFLLVWGMAILLRRYSSWSLLLQISAFVTVCVVLFTFAFQESLILWWSSHISSYMKVVVDAGYLNADEVLSSEQVLLLSHMASGVEVLLLLLMASFKLAIARWWEARIVKTIAFRKELLQARLDRWVLLLFVALLLAAIVFKALVFVEALIPLAGFYIVTGLCMLHYWMQGYKYARSALFGFYIVVIIFPYALGFALVLGLVDSGLNLKVRILESNVKK